MPERRAGTDGDTSVSHSPQSVDALSEARLSSEA